MEPLSSKDIEDERLKLQQDIQRIQDTLYDDSYSEYDSDTDSECLEIDLDRRNQTDDDSQTRSSIGESSTSRFEGTEVSDGTDCEQGIFVGDAEATELPVTTESSLALNRAYQEVIVDILRQIEESLEENRQKQEDAERDLIGQREKSLNATQFKIYYKQYSMPYIKDPNGGVPPPNEDVMLKKMLKEHKQEILPERDWLSRDRKKMYDAIAEDALQQLLQPLMIRLELEQEKLEKCQTKEAAAIKTRIKAIEKDMANKRKTSRADLLKNVDVNKTDWLKISNIAYDGRKTWQECKIMWMNVLNPTVNRGKWETSEDSQLTDLVKKFKGKNWEMIAQSLKTGRTAYQCLQRYQMYLNPENTNRPWTAEEDKKLLQVVGDIRNGGHRLVWAKVSGFMENRSGNMCFHRFHQIDPNMRRGPWTHDEDLKLYAAVKLCGIKSWSRLAEFVPGRSSLQCRDRWSNSLDPSLRMGNWTYEEDKKLLKAVQTLGTKSWTKLAALLPGRTDNMVLQRYKRLENWQRKTKWFEELPEVTKRALLGSHLSPEELKEKETLTWQNFQKELCVDKDDYRLQEQDREQGDIVVPRPPPLLGYTTMIPKRVIESRIHLQNIILKHLRSIQGHSDCAELSIDPKTQDELAHKVQVADADTMSVRRILELSRNMKTCLSQIGQPRARKPRIVSQKRTYNFNALRKTRRIDSMLRETVQSIYKIRKKMKKGRPRKFFNRVLTGYNPDEEMHNIKVKSLNLIMKALDIDARKMLCSATKLKEQRSSAVSVESTSASTSAQTPDVSKAPVKSTATKAQVKTSRRQSKEVVESESEDEPVYDVEMLRSVSQKETERGETDQEDEDIVGIVVDQTENRDSNVKLPVKPTDHNYVREVSSINVSKSILSEVPKKKTVTFLEHPCTVQKPSTPAQSTNVIVKGVLRSPSCQPVSNSVPDPATSKSTTTSASASWVKLCTTSTSTSPSTSTSGVKMCTASTQVINLSDSESSDDSLDFEENTKSLPLLPPNVTNLNAFKTLLLNRRKQVLNAGILYNPAFYPLGVNRWRPKQDKVSVDSPEVNGKRSSPVDETDAPAAKKTYEETVEECRLTRARLKKIRNSEDYQLLKARFQSIFIWPALMSTIHPPFDRKDFGEKANYITAGETEVEHVPRPRTKGYPLNRSHRFYKKMVRPRAEKEARKKKQGTTGEPREPPASESESLTEVDFTTPLVMDLSGSDDTETKSAEPTEPAEPVKRRGRPRGKTKPFVIEKSSRSMRERKERVVPEKKAPRSRQARGLRVVKKRALLSQGLRDAMLKSVADMKEGLRPDPAKNIHIGEPGKPADMPKNVTVMLPPGTQTFILKSLTPEENSPSVSDGTELVKIAPKPQTTAADKTLTSTVSSNTKTSAANKMPTSTANKSPSSVASTTKTSTTGMIETSPVSKNQTSVASKTKTSAAEKPQLSVASKTKKSTAGKTKMSPAVKTKTTGMTETLPVSKTQTSVASKTKTSIAGKTKISPSAKTKASGASKTQTSVASKTQTSKPSETEPCAHAASTSAAGTAVVSLNSTGTTDTVSVPLANCKAVPMLLSYVKGVDGNLVPMLNPLPVQLLQSVSSCDVVVKEEKSGNLSKGTTSDSEKSDVAKTKSAS